MMGQKILVAVDMSEHARKALRTAIALSKLGRASLTIMAVGQLPEYAATVGEVSEAKSEIQKRWGPLLLQMQAEAKASEVEAVGELQFGHPAETIVKYLKKYPQDLIVVGHKGTSGIQDFLLGSVSSKVVHYAPCNVMIVK